MLYRVAGDPARSDLGGQPLWDRGPLTVWASLVVLPEWRERGRGGSRGQGERAEQEGGDGAIKAVALAGDTGGGEDAFGFELV